MDYSERNELLDEMDRARVVIERAEQAQREFGKLREHPGSN
jgi:hypothetical protein